MQQINLDAQTLLPHRAGMLFLDKALEGDDERIRASAHVGENHLFAEGGVLGSWVLIEYMAQTMALWTSWNAMRRGLPPPVGFLLGTRHFKSTVDSIAVGTSLLCEAERVFLSETDGIAQFQCKIFIDGALVAEAAINAFEPKDPASFLTSM